LLTTTFRWILALVSVLAPIARGQVAVGIKPDISRNPSWPSTRAILHQALDIPHRRCAELTAVLAAELGRTLVADGEGSPRRIELLGQHQPARLVQPHSLLELQRTHGCRRAEVTVEGGGAQSHPARQVVDPQWLVEVVLKPVDGPRELEPMVAGRDDLPQARSLRR